jgi:hypothetical protein
MAKEKVANRLYTTAAGTVTKDEAEAVGVRYESLNGDKIVAVTKIEDLTKIDPKGLLLFALFGAKTWIGNLYNQELSPDEVQARVDSVVAGEWPERQSIGGPRYDVDALALAITKVKGLVDPEPAKKRIVEEKGYGTMAMKVPEVLAAYNVITGKVATVASL